jgi:hypothetical protein
MIQRNIPCFEWVIRSSELYLIRWMRVSARSKYGHVADKMFVAASSPEEARTRLDRWADERGFEVYSVDQITKIGGHKSRVIY